MKLLHNIGISPSPLPHIASNYNTREQILACNEPLSFDGVYLNVYENRDVLVGKDVTLFVTGDYVGGDNTFDIGMPFERFCTWKQIEELVEMGCKLGWHSWSHRDLTAISHHELKKEVTPPFPMKYFAYPYGRYTDEVVDAVRDAGFECAWSVTQGNDNTLTLKRTYL